MNFKLVLPSLDYKDSYLEAMRAFQNEGLPWFTSLNAFEIETNFADYVNRLLAKPTTRTDKLVPETDYWAIVDGRFAGRISIRHELNANLRIEGGHIGYDTAPSHRGQGIATRMLKEALPLAKQLGLKKVLLTCNDSNVPSIRVIEKNGGVLEGTRTIPRGLLKRYYWINLEE